jgi:hypothetical protein
VPVRDDVERDAVVGRSEVGVKVRRRRAHRREPRVTPRVDGQGVHASVPDRIRGEQRAVRLRHHCERSNRHRARRGGADYDRAHNRDGHSDALHHDSIGGCRRRAEGPRSVTSTRRRFADLAERGASGSCFDLVSMPRCQISSAEAEGGARASMPRTHHPALGLQLASRPPRLSGARRSDSNRRPAVLQAIQES